MLTEINFDDPIVRDQSYLFRYKVKTFDSSLLKNRITNLITKKLEGQEFYDISYYIYDDYIDVLCKYQGSLNDNLQNANEYTPCNAFIVYTVVTSIAVILTSLAITLMLQKAYKVGNSAGGVITTISIVIIVIIIGIVMFKVLSKK